MIFFWFWSRPDELAHHKVPYAHAAADCKTLEECVDQLKPSALIGVAAVGQAFTNPILKKMAAINKAPVIFALSNPTSKAECTAEEAYTATEGRSVCVVFAPPTPLSIETVAAMGEWEGSAGAHHK